MESSWDFVETTFPCVPLPPNSQRAPIKTKRLVIRPLREDDLGAYHEIRRQPEAMLGTALGKPDRDIAESRKALNDFLPSNDSKSFLFGVFLASTGELIGEGGVHSLNSSYSGWPEIGYKFKKEFWGQGYATEFLRALLEAWWKLPRSNTDLRVSSSSVLTTSETKAVEQVYALVVADKIGSRKVLEKLGFVQFSEWTEPDTQVHRLGEPVTLVGYRLPIPRGNTNY